MDDRLRILEMLREGKVSPEEAARLLDALEAEQRGRPAERSRVMRVRIRGAAGDNVNVAVPLSLADTILRFLPKGMRVMANGEEIDVARLLADIRESGAEGTILDVRDPSGRIVQIVVE